MRFGRKGSNISLATLAAALAVLMALAGCGGGGGSPPAPPPAGGNPQSVSVSGAVYANAAGAHPTALHGGAAPRGVPVGTPFAGAAVSAFDYATGLPIVLTPPVVTDNNGRYALSLPKGKDVLLFFTKDAERLSTSVPKACDNLVVPAADFLSSVATETLLATAGKSNSLSDNTFKKLKDALAAVPGALNDNSFTVGNTSAVVAPFSGGLLGTGLTSAGSTLQASATALLATLPPPPGKLVPSISSGDNAVTLSWTASPAGDNVTGYYIYRRPTAGVTRMNSTDNVLVAASGFTGSHTVQGLTDNTTYYFVVTAVNAGGESAESAELAGTPKAPVAGVPSGLKATPGAAQIALTWNAVDNATAYTLYWSTSATMNLATGGKISVPKPATGNPSYTQPGLTNGTVYYYTVTATVGGVESAASAGVSAAPEYAGAPGLLDAKALLKNLRDTAQTLTNYRNRGVTASNGVLDNVVSGLDNQARNVVAPYFTNFRQSFDSFVPASFRALADARNLSTGKNYTWDTKTSTLGSGLARSDQKVVVTTIDNSLTITLTPASVGVNSFTLYDFTVTSSADNVLDYHGTFSGLGYSTVTVGSNSYRSVTSAAIAGSFANTAAGGPTRTTTFNANTAATFDASSNLTGFSVALGFVSPVLKGSAQMSAAGTVTKELLTGNDNNMLATVSQIKLTNAKLEVVGKGIFTGNFQIDGIMSGFSQEKFRVVKSGGSPFLGELTLYWDMRDVTTPKLLGCGGGVLSGDIWPIDPPTISNDFWIVHLHNWQGTATTVVLQVSGTGNARAVKGSVSGSSPIDFGTEANGYLGRKDLCPIPVTATFNGGYQNLDPAVPLSKIDGQITGTLLNPVKADPFIVNTYEAYAAMAKDNFPRVRLAFTGNVTFSTAFARPPIRLIVNAENRIVAKGSPELPSSDANYVVVDGSTSYSDGTESVTGTGTVYAPLLLDSQGFGDMKGTKADFALTSAKGVLFNLTWNQGSGISGTFKSGGSTYGTLADMAGAPIVRWNDGTFESLP